MSLQVPPGKNNIVLLNDTKLWFTHKVFLLVHTFREVDGWVTSPPPSPECLKHNIVQWEVVKGGWRASIASTPHLIIHLLHADELTHLPQLLLGQVTMVTNTKVATDVAELLQPRVRIQSPILPWLWRCWQLTWYTQEWKKLDRRASVYRTTCSFHHFAQIKSFSPILSLECKL